MIDLETAAKLGAPLLTLIVGAIIKHYATGRAKLISYLGHISSFTLQGENPMVVNAHSVIVRNTGNKAAHNVRLAHFSMPPHISLSPPMQYSIVRNPEGAGEIVIPVLVPKEQVTISYLYFPPLTWQQINSTTKSDEGFAKIITAIPTPQPNKVVVVVLQVLVFLGASVVIYWAMRAIGYAI